MDNTFENWLVVSDIDGTLNNKIRRLPKRNYDAIKEFTEKGGNFTLSAGKSRIEEALQHNEKFIIVKVVGSEPGDEDGFMNFANMVKL